ncbi:phosphoenolpyruvate carboxylase kinase 1-like [Momordica charantia]|uniref:Phosphoenolpyruvate carboxylase kinase 1-like n=1 Tax=Momordica charantia TaxID=3673 RepID=A0A6J1CYJ8_MOMCH|nr:phosphoenolpyruvate carboxylase kinase 1-like [Momordica charantia]
MSDALKRDYQVIEEIGRGRFGTVFRCTSRASGEFYAVKTIDRRRISAGDSLDAECLVNETKILHLLYSHPHILALHDLYEDEFHLHMVLDLCSSSDLHTRITLQVFSEAQAASIMSQLMQALAHCHRLGVAHRDIKPDNILFDEWDSVKLADFGSAEMFRQGEESMNGVVGTPYYVAPEVLAGKDYGEKVDVWSAGVVLYVMLAGFPPFHGESVAEIFHAVLRANLRFPSRVFHSVSPAAKDLLRKMLCKDVFRRFSAEQVLRHPWITSCGGARPATELA